MRPRKVILSVDSNEQVLSVRKFMLETRGYRVVNAADAMSALAVFEDGGVDLVLTDLLLPQMDGNEMVRRMKQTAPDVPMLIVSGTVKAYERADAADAFLPKGAVTPLELLERIRLLLARKRGPRKQIATAKPMPAAGAGVMLNAAAGGIPSVASSSTVQVGSSAAVSPTPAIATVVSAAAASLGDPARQTTEQARAS